MDVRMLACDRTSAGMTTSSRFSTACSAERALRAPDFSTSAIRSADLQAGLMRKLDVGCVPTGFAQADPGPAPETACPTSSHSLPRTLTTAGPPGCG